MGTWLVSKREIAGQYNRRLCTNVCVGWLQIASKWGIRKNIILDWQLTKNARSGHGPFEMERYQTAQRQRLLVIPRQTFSHQVDNWPAPKTKANAHILELQNGIHLVLVALPFVLGMIWRISQYTVIVKSVWTYLHNLTPFWLIHGELNWI